MFLIGVVFLSACISGSAQGTTASGSAVFVNVVSRELKGESVYRRIGYVIESPGGYGGLKRDSALTCPDSGVQ